MSPLPFSFRFRRHPPQPTTVSRESSPPLSDDENAITPIRDTYPTPQQQRPLRIGAPAAPGRQFSSTSPTPAELYAQQLASYHSRRGSATTDRSEPYQDRHAHFDPADGEDIDTEQLWRRMLAIQQRFNCYRSARMSAALEDEAVGAIVPSRACLDLLNDSISQLPWEERRELDRFVHHYDWKHGGI